MSVTGRGRSVRHTYVVAISAGALAMAGCGSEPPDDVPGETAVVSPAPAARPDVIGADGEALWTSLYQEAEYVEQHESPTAMGEASDLVVVARPADFEVGTVIEDEEAPEGSVVFGFMRLQDVDVIAGEPRADSVQVAFWMPGRPENAREAVAEADFQPAAGAGTVLLARDRRLEAYGVPVGQRERAVDPHGGRFRGPAERAGC
jgi:hypothetical protein